MNDDRYKKIFSNNLKKYMSINNKDQIDLINDLHLNKSAVSTWCNGTRLPRMDKVDLLSNYFKINRSDLIEESNGNPLTSRGIKIPVLGKVVAGIPFEAIEDILDYEEISPELASTGEFFALQVKGSSMEPRILNGDVVIVKKQSSIENGETGVILINGSEATVKKVKREEKGITLIAFNTSVFEPQFYSNEEIEKLPLTIIGKVVELRGKF